MSSHMLITWRILCRWEVLSGGSNHSSPSSQTLPLALSKPRYYCFSMCFFLSFSSDGSWVEQPPLLWMNTWKNKHFKRFTHCCDFFPGTLISVIAPLPFVFPMCLCILPPSSPALKSVLELLPPLSSFSINPSCIFNFCVLFMRLMAAQIGFHKVK